MDTAESEERPSEVRLERDVYRRLLLLGAHDDVETCLAEALDLVTQLCGADRGYLESRPGAGRAHRWVAAGYTPKEVSRIRGKLSQGIIAHARSVGETVVTAAALEDPRFREQDSVREHRIGAVLCAPVGDPPDCGVLYLHWRNGRSFSTRVREYAELAARALAPVLERLELRREIDELGDACAEVRARFTCEAIIGRSAALARALDLACMAAKFDVTLLITGPTGTGKTQLASAIRDNSGRAGEAFIPVNCATIRPELAEAELFGAVRGAHSTAFETRVGHVEAAHGGVLFLDEVAELAPAVQAKLLQFAQDRSFSRLGESTVRTADVRIIAATNADLDERIAAGAFRADLRYRLDGVSIAMPGLDERAADILPLARHFCGEEAARRGSPGLSLDPAAYSALRGSDWPGHVRELRARVEGGVLRALHAEARSVTIRHLFPEEQADEGAVGGPGWQDATRAYQRTLLADRLEHHGWNVAAAARSLDLSRSSLYDLIRSHELSRPESRG